MNNRDAILDKAYRTDRDDWIELAMDEYAKEVAIDFAIWTQENMQYWMSGGEWSVLERSAAESKTSSELFEMYQQEKLKQS